MAANSGLFDLQNNTSANFRLWGLFISAQLLAGGWTKMATDIDWTTVAAPAQNTFAGYEIWQSPAESGLSPFYLKLQYGSHNNAVVGPAIAYQISFSYSGSGSALGGTPSTEISSRDNPNAADATARFCTAAFGTGYGMINLGSGLGGTQQVITFNRTRDSALAPKDEILHYSGKINTSYSPFLQTNVISPTKEWIGVSGQTGALNDYRSRFVVFPTGKGVSGGVVNPAFILGDKGGTAISPLETFLGVFPGSVGSPRTTVDWPIFGVSRRFMIGDVPASSQSASAFTNSESTSFSALYIYD